MGAALSRHDEVLAEVVYANHGTIVKSTGDGVHAVFRRRVTAWPPRSTASARSPTPNGPATSSLRVRMGVHLGDATERGGDWYGTEVNRAPRVMSVAHGGQIVCTRVVEELVRADSTCSTSASTASATCRAPSTCSRSTCRAHPGSTRRCGRSTPTGRTSLTS